jgi:hypothetical protein
MGMRLRLTFIYIIIISLFGSLKANPVQSIYFSEFMFLENGWVLEMTNDYATNYDGWFIATNNDTVQFKSGISPDGEFYIIEPDDMMGDLYINSNRDNLVLLDKGKHIHDHLSFGKEGYITAPKLGQSINVIRGFYSGLYYYLDNTPTIGLMNDKEGAEGTVEGFIVDFNNKPVNNVAVIYDEYWSDTRQTITDQYGHFYFTDYARLLSAHVKKDSYIKYNVFSVQIFPDSTITLDTIKLDIIDAIENENYFPDEFILIQNYPNPFNPTTTIKFSIPNVETLHATSLQHITLKIYDMLGREVATLVNEEKAPGNYEVTFNGTGLTSGIYFYRLQSRSFGETKKFVLLK